MTAKGVCLDPKVFDDCKENLWRSSFSYHISIHEMAAPWDLTVSSALINVWDHRSWRSLGHAAPHYVGAEVLRLQLLCFLKDALGQQDLERQILFQAHSIRHPKQHYDSH